MTRNEPKKHACSNAAGRLTALKVPNFIRHSDTELIALLVKGKTLHLKFTPNENGG